MGADELGAKVSRRVNDQESELQTCAAFESLRLHFSDAYSAVEMRPPKLFGELKKREQGVRLLASLEFAELP